MKYVFPAVFTPEENGFSVAFPNLEGCYTCGQSMEETLFLAEDVLCLTLYDYEEAGRPIPKPADVRSLEVGDSGFATLVEADTQEYREYFDNRAVKKTLTIPAWLNKMAEKRGINFSQVLQDSLKERLGLNDR